MKKLPEMKWYQYGIFNFFTSHYYADIIKPGFGSQLAQKN
jgi:hypothetical protein